MAALFDALFRGLRGENVPAVKQVKKVCAGFIATFLHPFRIAST